MIGDGVTTDGCRIGSSLPRRDPAFMERLLASVVLLALLGCGSSPKPNTFTGDPQVIGDYMRETFEHKYGCAGIGISKPVWASAPLSMAAALSAAKADYMTRCGRYPHPKGFSVALKLASNDGRVYVVCVVATP